MRLRELDAELVAEGSTPGSFRRVDSMQEAQGVLFQCPSCAAGAERAEDGGFKRVHYLLVWFANPPTASVPPAELTPRARWTVSGDSLDTLTLMPSIDATVSGSCGFHGFVENGGTRNA